MDSYVNENNPINPENHLDFNDDRDKKDGHARLQRAYWLVIILVSIIGLGLKIYTTFFRK